MRRVRLRPVAGSDGEPDGTSAHWQRRGDGGGSHSGDRGGALDERVGETRQRCLRIFRIRQGQIERLQARRGDAGVEVLGVAQAAHEERRGDEQRGRQRHLADDERGAEPLPARDSTGGGAQRFVRLGSGEDQRRTASENQRRERARAESEEEDRPVDGEGPQARNRGR